VVLPCTFSLRLPDRFILPCDLQDDTHDAGRLLLGLLQAPLGAGPMASVGRHISRIFILIFNPFVRVDHCFIVVYATVAALMIVHKQLT
jgi:hypothetical protein